jgi:hypothetical protein
VSPRETHALPDVGDEISVVRTGVGRRGRVCYVDQLQVLVKWDDGGSSSLRVDHTPFQIIPTPELRVTRAPVARPGWSPLRCRWAGGAFDP